MPTFVVPWIARSRTLRKIALGVLAVMAKLLEIAVILVLSSARQHLGAKAASIPKFWMMTQTLFLWVIRTLEAYGTRLQQRLGALSSLPSFGRCGIVGVCRAAAAVHES